MAIDPTHIDPAHSDLRMGVRLPTLPAVAARLVDAAAAPDVDASLVADLVGLDHALTALVLRAANATQSVKCGSVHAALDHIGVSALTSLALGAMLAEGLEMDLHGFNSRTFRRWSVYTAVSARSIARMSGVWDEHEAYSTALLQDIGVVALARHIGPQYVELLSSTTGDHHKLGALEESRWGVHHAAVSAAAARSWNLPDHVCDAIEAHHNTNDSATMAVRVLDLAGTLAAVLLGSVAEEAMQSLRARADAWFAISGADTETLVRQVAQEGTALLSHMKLRSRDSRDVDALLVQAEEQWVRHQATAGHRTRELERRNQDLSRRADSDTLTGVGTRGMLERAVPHVTSRCADRGQPLAVAFIDVDGLKPINDVLGHAIGDDMLRRVAGSIVEAAGPDAQVCRFGGDEFVVLLPGESHQDALARSEAIRVSASIAGRRGADAACTVTLSIGCATLAGDQMYDTAGLDLMAAADQAMYVAKNGGGDAVELVSLTVPVQREAA